MFKFVFLTQDDNQDRKKNQVVILILPNKGVTRTIFGNHTGADLRGQKKFLTQKSNLQCTDNTDNHQLRNQIWKKLKPDHLSNYLEAEPIY